MTELEALAKDCIENHTHRLVDKPTKQDIYLREESIFIQGYRQSEKRIAELEALIKEIKSDVNECFGYEYNILVAKLLNKWEIKENDKRRTYKNFKRKS